MGVKNQGADIMFIIKNPMPNATIARTVRFTEELFEELHAVSASHNMSFNMLVLQCCRYALDNMLSDFPKAKN